MMWTNDVETKAQKARFLAAVFEYNEFFVIIAHVAAAHAETSVVYTN